MEPDRRSMPTKRRLAAGGLGLLTLAGLALTLAYVERGPIGVRLATDYLRRQGVPASIRIDRLDTAGFSGALRLGPVGDPDLTVDRLEVTFEPAPLWSRAGALPRIKAIRLVRPQIKARFDGRRLTFGSLQRLVDAAQRGPSGGPGPSVSIQAGRLTLDTPAGAVVVTGDGALERGRIAWVSARLAPGDLTMPGLRVSGLAGEVHLAARGAERLEARWRLTAAAVAAKAGLASRIDLDGAADAPYGRGGFARLDGSIQAHTALGMQSVTSKAVSAREVQARLQAAGDVHGPLQALRFAGPASATLRAAAIAFDDGSMHKLAFGLESRRAAVAWLSDDPTPRIDAPLHLVLNVQGGRLAVARRSLSLGAMAADAMGDVRLVAPHWNVNLAGNAGGGAALDPSTARQAARSIVPDGAAVGIQDALAQNLQSVRLTAPTYRIATGDERLDLTLDRPVRAAFAHGGSIELSGVRGGHAVEFVHGVASGGLGVELDGPSLPTVRARIGRYRVAGGRGAAEVSLDVRGPLGPARGAAFALQAAVEDRNGRLQLIARDCAKLSAKALDRGTDTLARDVTAKVCPTAAAPLFTLDGRRWSATGRVEAVSASLPDAQVRVSELDGGFVLRGGSLGPAGHVTLDHARIADTGRPARVNPLVATGEGDLTSASWRGRIDLGLSPVSPSLAGVTLGRLTFLHDPRTQRGTASFTTTLHFVPKAFQPASVAPQSRPWLSDVQGAVDVSVEAAWSDGPMTSRADIRTAALDLRTPAGSVAGLHGDLKFVALAPLQSEPNQRLDARQVDTLLPLTALSATFDLNPTDLVLHQASATLAHGQVSLAPMAIPLSGPGDAMKSPPNGLVTQGALTLKAVDVGDIVKVLNLAEAVSIQARIDGVLPFALGPAGLRISAGRVAADGPGRLTIRRQALSGASAAGPGTQINAVQDFAYQALENLAFDSLEADVASRPQGRLGVVLHVRGRHDPPTAPPTRVGLIDLLRGHAFDRPIPLPKGTPVDLTLDSSLNLDELLAAYGGMTTPAGSAGVQLDAPK